jgi:large subunit ribosomal protein L25
MSVDFSLNAKVRDDKGKGASRRLRRQADRVPAIVYGADKAPQNISVLHKDLAKALESEAFYTHIIKLDIEGNVEDVLLKDLQRHPAKAKILHADFFRINQKQAVVIRVPLHFTNENTCVGVKSGGGVISHNVSDLEVRCLPANIPEYIEVDMSSVGLGEIVHLSDLRLPEGVESVQLSHGEDHDLAVAMVNAPKTKAEDEASAETEASGEKSDDAAEKKKEE